MIRARQVFVGKIVRLSFYKAYPESLEEFIVKSFRCFENSEALFNVKENTINRICSFLEVN